MRDAEDRALDPEEAGEILGVGGRIVVGEIHAGRLDVFRVGRRWRVMRSAVDRYVRTQLAAERSVRRRLDLLRGGADAVPAFMREASS